MRINAAEITSGARRVACLIAAAALLCTGALVFAEGLASALLFALDMRGAQPALRLRYRCPDPLIGSRSLPGLSIQDFFGPGKHLTTDSRGLRSKKAIPARSPRNRLRILCSGDSMTFGYGVGDKDTWPRSLEGRDPRIETVNMGQTGYGLDQMYLLYLREGVRLEHGVHILGLTPFDMSRIRLRTAVGAVRKPVLVLRDGRLAVTNYPVRQSWLPRVLRRFMYPIYKLRITALAAKLRSLPGDAQVLSSVEDRADAIFDGLERISRKNGVTLVVVYLPVGTEEMIRRYAGQDVWREYLTRALSRRDIAFFDLSRDLLDLPAGRLSGSFYGKDSIYAGHYTEEGSRYVAGLVYKRLASIPEISGSLKAAGRSRRRGAPPTNIPCP